MATRTIEASVPVTARSAFLATLLVIEPTVPYNRVLLDPASDLPTLADLYANGGAGIDEQLDVLRGYLATDDKDIPVALGAMSFPWLVSTVAITAFLTADRVPDLSPTNVSYTFAEYGYPKDIVFRTPRFSALAGDPAAGDPDVRIVANRDDLLRVLQRELGEHLDGALAIMRARGARVGMGTIRRTAAEASLSALCSVAAKLGRLEHLRADVASIFQTGDGANPLLLRRLPLIREFPTGSGGRAASVELTTCCLRFRIEGRGTCPACPNQDPAERTRRMAESAMLYG